MCYLWGQCGGLVALGVARVESGMLLLISRLRRMLKDCWVGGGLIALILLVRRFWGHFAGVCSPLGNASGTRLMSLLFWHVVVS